MIAFTAHSVVFVDLDPAWVRGLLPPGDLSGPLLPPFLQALSVATGRRVNSTDLLCVAAPEPGSPEYPVRPGTVPPLGSLPPLGSEPPPGNEPPPGMYE